MMRRVGPVSAVLFGLYLLGASPGALRAVADLTPAPVDKTQATNPLVNGGSQPKSVLDKTAPENIADLRELEARLGKLIESVTSCTVSVRTDQIEGSGVIVSKDGYVLTAAHVSGAPGRAVTLVLADGRHVQGRTLGLMHGFDAGLIKISDEGTWPFAKMADMLAVSVGDWCVATGHPGGYRPGRKPVVRLGRVALTTQRVVQSDCTLVGGDSGGPLFNMDGEVIGVHSRIGAANTWNFHVPVAVYTHSWEQLIASREWNGFAVPGTAVLGIDGDDHKLGCRISKVVPGYPASDAKLQVDDVIVKFDGKTFDRFETLRQFIVAKKPGDTVKLEVQRGKQTMTANVVLGMRRSAW